MRKLLATRVGAPVVGALIVAGIIVMAPVASAQDATTLPQAQTPPQPQPDTSSPLTPQDGTGSPLTPAPINPVTGQTQSSSSDATQSSSEVPTTFIQPPIETNRLDVSAPSEQQLEIDPSSSQAASLSPDTPQLTPTAAGVSLNAVQGTTSTTSPSSLGSSIPSPTSTIVYPAAISEPASTQAFLTSLQSAHIGSGLSSRRVGSSSTSMGPLIGSDAVKSSSPVETMSSGPTAIGASAFMRSPSSSSRIIRSSFASASVGSNSIGPSALRSNFGGSSSTMSHHSMSSSHR
ncbi:hypothetical protein [Hyphomicrobium sp.]|jgi:hypothetical protein|uniref:hypothetical protein n=1 Tax=Hyphomicrobium sp. TaxID=82 RepID=UPI00356B549B